MASKQTAQPAKTVIPQEDDETLVAPPGLSEAAKRWIAENAEAIRSSNEYVEKHGLPLAKYRMF